MRRQILTMRRRAQSGLIRRIRSSRLFPQTVVNRLGDDATLADRRLDAAVIVYFPGAPDTLYQVLPWLDTFGAVHAVHGLTIVCQDSRVAGALRAAADVPVMTLARYGTLDAMLGRSSVKLALYVSHVPRNFEALRFGSLLHAYIGHGDSDKGVSASNQLKAYDYVFAPGAAAVARIATRLMRFDVEEHCIVVGQPLAFAPVPRAAEHETERTVVLYAPTWEGGQPSVAYSSVLSHGERMVAALLADRRYAVVYRPHPLIGVTSGEYAAADAAIRSLVAAAAEAEPAAGHAVVPATAEAIEASFVRSDALITDVSAVATAWLPTLRPFVVTQAVGAQSVAADAGMLTVVPRIGADDAGSITSVIGASIGDDGGRAARQALVTDYLSPYWPDGVAARFVAVCGEVIAERDVLRQAMLSAGATGV